MKLVSYSVKNFRSITTAHKVPISEATTTLIGPNNEGKSNILISLALAMDVLLHHAYRAQPGRAYRRRVDYDWERDFPVHLRDRRGSKLSVFRLDFELGEAKLEEFRHEIGSRLNGTLPIEVSIGQDNKPDIKIAKKGRGTKTLNTKSAKIADFVARQVFFNYIPAIRTERESIDIIGDMLADEMAVLDNDERYQKALATITELQGAVLEKLALRIKEPLCEFLPGVKNVRIDLSDDLRSTSYRRRFAVIVDDGTPTKIEYKGDGVKSLAALGLLKNREMKAAASIIAIEEPESHLHPAAIHQVNDIINALAEEEIQIIVTTHNPLFVNRIDIRSNILIENGKATSAKSIGQIRKILGVRTSDNLQNAKYALVVEGKEDKDALEEILPTFSQRIAGALKSNLFVIETLDGAGNLSYKLSLLKNALCVYHVLLDNDEAGRKAFKKACADGYLSDRFCTFTTCKGMKESEFEDCIDASIYQGRMEEEFGFNVTKHPAFRSSDKWSDRMKKAFLTNGKLWDDELAQRLKDIVASSVVDNPAHALNEHKRNSIDALLEALESMIKP